jgi:hypothetical protein
MTTRRKANAASFRPGVSGNPKGRPKGIQETKPRGYLRAAIDAVMATDPKKLIAAIRRGLDDPRYAHGWAELIAKVGKEIGADAAHDTKPVIFHFHTNLNPLALSGRVLQQQRSLPHGPEPTDGPASPSRPSRARRPGHHAERAGLPAGPAADAGE